MLANCARAALTRSERRIAELAADGRQSREIADALAPGALREADEALAFAYSAAPPLTSSCGQGSDSAPGTVWLWAPRALRASFCDKEAGYDLSVAVDRHRRTPLEGATGQASSMTSRLDSSSR
jgi:hypothetical protein